MLDNYGFARNTAGSEIPTAMTIAKRLILLLAVPLLIILCVGFATRQELSRIETSTRYVAESRVVALARIGDITRKFAEMAVATRNSILETDPSLRAAMQAKADAARIEVRLLLDDYGKTGWAAPREGSISMNFRKSVRSGLSRLTRQKHWRSRVARTRQRQS